MRKEVNEKCPNCGSWNVFYLSSDLYKTSTLYQCGKCYEVFSIETEWSFKKSLDERKMKKDKEEFEKNPKTDDDYGGFGL